MEHSLQEVQSVCTHMHAHARAHPPPSVLTSSSESCGVDGIGLAPKHTRSSGFMLHAMKYVHCKGLS